MIVTVIFGILGILCLIYYGVIVIYSGAGTSFSAIWIVLALGFFIMAAVGKFYPRIRDRVPVQIEVAVITFFSAIAFIFIVVELLMGFGALSFQKESVNYVIVLGAQVRGNTISRTLERRLEKAVEYAAYHPNTVFVLSGGQGDDAGDGGVFEDVRGTLGLQLVHQSGKCAFHISFSPSSLHTDSQWLPHSPGSRGRTAGPRRRGR